MRHSILDNLEAAAKRPAGGIWQCEGCGRKFFRGDDGIQYDYIEDWGLNSWVIRKPHSCLDRAGQRPAILPSPARPQPGQPQRATASSPVQLKGVPRDLQ